MRNKYFSSHYYWNTFFI